jgi:hypothetical protein
VNQLVPSNVSIWRSASLSRAIVLLAAQLLMCADYAIRGGIDSIDEHFGTILIAAVAAMLLCLIGLIGWGTSSTKSKCAGIGIVAVLASIAVCILETLVGGTNVHGPFYLIFLPMLLISFAGMILLLIAAFGRGSKSA